MVIEITPGNTVDRTTRRVGLQTSTKPASNWGNKYKKESNGIRKKYSDSYQFVLDNELENIYLAQYVLIQMSVKTSIRQFGSDATDTVIKEWKYMDEKDIFVPRLSTKLSREDKVRALRIIMFY